MTTTPKTRKPRKAALPAAPVSPAIAPLDPQPTDRCRLGHDLCVLPSGHPGWCEVEGGPTDPRNHDSEPAPEPAAAGTFAIYESPDGGVVLVLNLARGTYVDAGQLPLGEQKMKVPAPLMRMIMSLANSAGPGGGLKGMILKRLHV